MNGTDLIQQLGAEDTGDEISMVAASARRAAALLRFYRLAFGSAGSPDMTVTRAQLREQVEDVMQGPRMQIGWSAPEGPAVGLPVARLVYLMLLAGRAMLGTNGTLRVVMPSAGALPLAVIAEGGHAWISDNQRLWLAGAPGPTSDSRQVEIALIGQAASAAGVRIELIEGNGQRALHTVPV